MKTILNALAFLIIMMTSSATVFAQELVNPKVGDTIVLKSWCRVIGEPIAANTNTSNPLSDNYVNMLEPGVKFIINEMNDTLVMLVALDFRRLSESALRKLQEVKPGVFEKSDYYNGKIYAISRNDFANSAAKPEEKHRVSIGLLTLPFKARPQGDFSFDTEFNLSTTLNVQLFKVNNANFNLQVGAGIGTVSLNTAVADGIEAEEAQDVTILSFLSGVMLQYKRIQAGIYIGVDQINNQEKYKWKNNGNLWFGFGIGFNVFNVSLGKTSNTQSP